MTRAAGARNITLLTIALLCITVALWSARGLWAAGNTITTVDFAGDGGFYTSIALGADGNPVIVHQDLATQTLRIVRCGDQSCRSGNAITSHASGLSADTYASLVLDQSDNPVVSYYDNDDRGLGVLRCGNPACSSSTIALPDTATINEGLVGRFSSLALDAVSSPVVSYYDDDTKDLKLLRCGNLTCTSGNVITTPDSVGDVGQWSALALDSIGNPVVAYGDITNQSLKVLHCGDSTCTAGNSVASPDPGDTASYISLKLDGLGRPVVSYRSGGGLKMLRCGDANCAGGNTVVDLSPGDNAIDTSLELGAGDIPVISYAERDGEDLKVLRCDTPDCATYSVTAPDADGYVGLYSSLVLDGLGRPIVSYHEALPNFDLKVLHCGDLTCEGSESPTLGPSPSPGAGPVGGVVGLMPDGKPRLGEPSEASPSYWLVYALAGLLGLTAGTLLAGRVLRR